MLSIPSLARSSEWWFDIKTNDIKDNAKNVTLPACKQMTVQREKVRMEMTAHSLLSSWGNFLLLLVNKCQGS